MKIFVLVNVSNGYAVAAYTSFEKAKVEEILYSKAYPMIHYQVQEIEIKGDV